MNLDYLSHTGFAGHKAVHILRDEDTGLLAIVAIHNDDLGTALGGTRMLPYPDFGTALTDVLRLSEGMTKKAAMSALNYGGGKCVIIGDPKTAKTPELLHALGRKLNSLGGQFITGEDVNISVADIELVAEKTTYVAGRSETVPGGSGDPSIMTALGVLHGIRAALKHKYGDDSLKGRAVAIMGVGKVGFRLARLLHQRQAKIFLSDSDPHMAERALKEFGGALNVPVEDIYDQKCDVFAPCALGSILNSETIPRLQCAVVAGAANNQLATPEDGHLLHKRKIPYAVDYVINAGGLINVTDERNGGYDEARARRATEKIYDRILLILTHAEAEDCPPHEIAEKAVKRILEAAHQLKKIRREFGLL